MLRSTEDASEQLRLRQVKDAIRIGPAGAHQLHFALRYERVHNGFDVGLFVDRLEEGVLAELRHAVVAPTEQLQDTTL